jgi:hypothetical protein
MREIRPSGSEGGVALTRHPYPYRWFQLLGAFVEGRIEVLSGDGFCEAGGDDVRNSTLSLLIQPVRSEASVT